MKLVWRDQLRVGNNVIDSDHKYLIDLINMVQESLAAKNRVELTRLLDDLLNYSLVHFAREERIADAAGYSQVSRLNQSHQSLIKQLHEVKTEMSLMGDDWSLDVSNHFTQFLHDWFINHVLNEDLLMKPEMEKLSSNFYP